MTAFSQHKRRGQLPGQPARPPRREQNKLDKLNRIREAARFVFLSKGYDNATARAIASRAKVGLGTLFLYATDKRDLLFLVINDDFEAVGKAAADAVRLDASFMENLLAAFGKLYEFFNQNPQLWRFLLREIFFYQDGRQAARLAATRDRMVGTVGQIVRIAQGRDELDLKADPVITGRVLFSVYQLEVRTWLAQRELDVAQGMSDLARALTTAIVGLSPKPGALSAPMLTPRGDQESPRAYKATVRRMAR